MAYRKRELQENNEKLNEEVKVESVAESMSEMDATEPVTVVQEQKKPEPKRKEREMTDLIKCRSVVQGTLIFKGPKSQTNYRWDAPNDVVYVEYQDLRSARLSKHQFLMRGYFIIEDDDLLNEEEWIDVKKKYGEMYNRKDLVSIFKIDNVQDMVRAINSLPDGVKAQMGNIAKSQMESGQLDSIRKIKAIDSVLGTDLMLFVDGD